MQNITQEEYSPYPKIAENVFEEHTSNYTGRQGGGLNKNKKFQDSRTSFESRTNEY